jgi:hypothetical protein
MMPLAVRGTVAIAPAATSSASSSSSSGSRTLTAHETRQQAAALADAAAAASALDSASPASAASAPFYFNSSGAAFMTPHQASPRCSFRTSCMPSMPCLAPLLTPSNRINWGVGAAAALAPSSSTQRHAQSVQCRAIPRQQQQRQQHRNIPVPLPPYCSIPISPTTLAAAGPLSPGRGSSGLLPTFVFPRGASRPESQRWTVILPQTPPPPG